MFGQQGRNLTLYTTDGSAVSAGARLHQLSSRTLHAFVGGRKPEAPLRDLGAPCCYFANARAVGAGGEKATLVLENPRDVIVQSLDHLQAQVSNTLSATSQILYLPFFTFINFVG